MSKKSRRRNKLLLAGAALFGASKLGMLGGKGTVTGAAGKDKRLFTDIKPKKFTNAIGPQKVNTKVAPGMKVNYKGEVIKKGVNTGVGNEKTKFVNLSPDKGEVGIYKGGKKVSDLNPKAINVLSDGKISSQGKIFDGKKEYRKFMDEKRALKKKTSLSKKTNKKNPGLFGFTFDKPLFKKGSMIKARGGGMARTKPTKMY
jgi:hypothetical protein